ncbi:MAG TPA: choline kinase family protein [Solirubrobacteraceae bacterium]|nr:choline kinase family protein [Solirubrobacteraceae bacterium]
MARLDELLARLQPSLGVLTGEPVPLSGGITNHNFRVTLGEEAYVVRVHGIGTKLLGIDRDAERVASSVGARLGIAPEVVASFDDCLVTRFIDCEPVIPRDTAEHVEAIAWALRSFHDSPTKLPTRFWVPDLLQAYADRVHELGVQTTAAYGRAATVAARIAAALPLDDPRPCHNDLLTSNLIRVRAGAGRAGGEMLIVDWEYAGMGHPYFDLGNLSVNNDFDEATDERLLRAYHGEPVTDTRLATLALMRILSDAREGAWGVVQAEISELDFDFDRYARTHFERMDAAIEQPQLEEWLGSAAAGRDTRKETDG